MSEVRPRPGPSLVQMLLCRWAGVAHVVATFLNIRMNIAWIHIWKLYIGTDNK